MLLDQSGSSRAMEVERLGSNGLFGTRTRAYGSDDESGCRRRRSRRTICARTPKGARNRPVPLCRRNQKRRRQRISRSCCASVLPNIHQTYHSRALARDSSATFPVTQFHNCYRTLRDFGSTRNGLRRCGYGWRRPWPGRLCQCGIALPERHETAVSQRDLQPSAI